MVGCSTLVPPSHRMGTPADGTPRAGGPAVPSSPPPGPNSSAAAQHAPVYHVVTTRHQRMSSAPGTCRKPPNTTLCPLHLWAQPSNKKHSSTFSSGSPGCCRPNPLLYKGPPARTPPNVQVSLRILGLSWEGSDPTLKRRGLDPQNSMYLRARILRAG